MTLTPAYGRDYKSQKAVRADFEQGKDFIVNDMISPWDGKSVNRRDLEGKFRSVTIRFNGEKNVVVVTV